MQSEAQSRSHLGASSGVMRTWPRLSTNSMSNDIGWRATACLSASPRSRHREGSALSVTCGETRAP